MAAPGLRGEEVGITLSQALDLAGAQNPGLQALKARQEAEAARTFEAKRSNWPSLSIESAWSRSNTPSTVFAQKLNAGEFTQEDFVLDRLNDPPALSHLTTAVVAEVPLDLFGRTGARADAQAALDRAAGADTNEAAQDLRLRVVEAYRRAALALRVVEVVERALWTGRAREADVEARVEQGATLQADLLRARARRRQREADLAEARAEARIATARLSRTLGADASVTYRPTETPPAPDPLPDDLSPWTTSALASRPLLRAALERASGGTSSVRAEERAGWPDLAAWGLLQDDRSDFSAGNQSGAFGVRLRWSVFDAARGKRVAAASAEARAAELSARAAADRVLLEVETAFRRARAARERYAAAAGGAEEGREALRVVRERRQQGLATLTDELETEAASLAAEMEELRVASEAAIADAALRRAAGGL
jgi:outer membrane protein TolC